MWNQPVLIAIHTTDMLTQGEELNVIMVPLHNCKVYLHSDMVTEPVAVEVQPTLPVSIFHSGE